MGGGRPIRKQSSKKKIGCVGENVGGWGMGFGRQKCRGCLVNVWGDGPTNAGLTNSGGQAHGGSWVFKRDVQVDWLGEKVTGYGEEERMVRKKKERALNPRDHRSLTSGSGHQKAGIIKRTRGRIRY